MLTEETLAPFPPCTGTSVNPRGGRELAGADVAAGAGEGAGVCLGAALAGAEAVPGAGLRVKEMGLLMGPRAITYAWGQWRKERGILGGARLIMYEHGAEFTMEMVLPAGPMIRALTSSSDFPDVAVDPIDMMRSPTCKCDRAVPLGERLEISKPPAAEGTIVAPIPVFAI